MKEHKMKLKLINFLLGLIIPTLLKGTPIMKISFIEGNKIQDVELKAEDIKQLMEDIRAILEMLNTNPATSKSLSDLISTIIKNI
jgi:hypothetical protein